MLPQPRQDRKGRTFVIARGSPGDGAVSMATAGPGGPKRSPCPMGELDVEVGRKLYEAMQEIGSSGPFALSLSAWSYLEATFDTNSQQISCDDPRGSSPGFLCAEQIEDEGEGGPQTGTMTECFDCDNCKESLYGRKYIQMDNGPYCIPCYDAHFANTCDECKELIGHDCRELYYEDRHYHEHCFRCFRCDRSLADEPFTCQGEELLCNDCYCSEFSSKCIACEKTVMPGSRKLEYNGQTWHEHCFICSSCQQPIGSRSFIPDKKDYYCVPCYESKFAPRCTRCKKTLTKGGVTYRDEPWHKECFVCTGCKTPLAGQQFTSQDDNPYCIKCFGNLYAKKCSACTKPITGFGGGKYVSFEDRHWHHNCFNCARCNTSLVGKGFIPDNDEILCRDCSSDL
ncbi:four and a half LIM domain protein 3 [Amazona aestiva]|uniref:Four and a half LIM domains protein 3 n=16 Tax=Neoaves TaxID=3078114 RepID=A0A0Q3U3A7_AMAAE|nr:four and a half LIM domain protein 3 [Amazona aestiva]